MVKLKRNCSDVELLENLKNKKISILIDNPLPKHIGEGKESYVGKITAVSKNFIILELNNNKRLTHIFIKPELILSIWVYRCPA